MKKTFEGAALTRKRHPMHAATFLVVALCSASVTGQEREMGIFTPGVRLSPDERYLAFFVGPSPAGGPAPWTRESQLFLIDLDANDVIRCQDFSAACSALAWEPKSEGRLFAMEDLVGNAGLDRTGLVGLLPSQRFIATVIREFEPKSKPIAAYEISVLAWSPNAEILAAGGGLMDIQLSFDGGKSFAPTRTARATLRLVWASDDILLAERWAGGDTNRILELKISAQGVDSVRTVAEGPRIQLCGVLNGQAIYRTEHDVYLGDTVFFHSEDRIGPVLATGQYVGVTLWSGESDTQILVCDAQRKVVSRRFVPRSTTLVGLSAKRQCIYLAERRPLQISSCGFPADSKTSTTWKIPQVQIPQEGSSKASIQGSTPRP